MLLPVWHVSNVMAARYAPTNTSPNKRRGNHSRVTGQANGRQLDCKEPGVVAPSPVQQSKTTTLRSHSPVHAPTGLESGHPKNVRTTANIIFRCIAAHPCPSNCCSRSKYGSWLIYTSASTQARVQPIVSIGAAGQGTLVDERGYYRATKGETHHHHGRYHKPECMSGTRCLTQVAWHKLLVHDMPV